MSLTGVVGLIHRYPDCGIEHFKRGDKVFISVVEPKVGYYAEACLDTLSDKPRLEEEEVGSSMFLWPGED